MLVVLKFLKLLLGLVALKLTLFEAEVVKLGFDLIIVIFRGMRRRGDNETTTEGKVLMVLPSKGSCGYGAGSMHNKKL